MNLESAFTTSVPALLRLTFKFYTDNKNTTNLLTYIEKPNKNLTARWFLMLRCGVSV